MIWGLAFTVVKTTLDFVPPVYMIAIRFSIASVVISLIFWKKLKSLNIRNIKHGVLIGVFLFLAYLTQTIGCKYTTAGKNAFLTALYIIVIPFLHWFISKKRPQLRLFLAAFLGIVGIGLISLQNDFSINIGDALTIACGILYAFQIVYIDKYTENDDPVILTILQMIVSAVLGWVCAPFFDGAFPAASMQRGDVWMGLLYLGLLSTLLCFFLQTLCQKYTKPENASLIMSTESVFGALGSVIFLGETISGKTLIGCIIMMVAILLAQIAPKKANGKKKP